MKYRNDNVMAKWYWILAAGCLIGAVGLTVSTWHKAKVRNIDELRKEGITDAFNERWQEAEDKLEVVVEDPSATARDWFMYGLSVHYLQEYEKALVVFQKAEDLGYPKHLTQYNLACGNSRLKRVEKGLVHLENAVDNQFVDYQWMKQDPDLYNLHTSPEFDRIVAKAKSKHAEKVKEGNEEAVAPVHRFNDPEQTEKKSIEVTR